MKKVFQYMAIAALATPLVAAQRSRTSLEVNMDNLQSGNSGGAGLTSRARYQRNNQPTGPGVNRPVYSKFIRTPISGVVYVRGMETNAISGFGVVTGLAGTGDSGDLVKSFMANSLRNYGIPVDATTLSSKNMAVVRVEAEIGPGDKPGALIDVRVSTIGDAKSLVGGVLANCELFGPNYDYVYATASGPVTNNAQSASGEAGSSSKNHNTVAIMSFGGKVEREVPTSITSDHGYIHLDAKKGQGTFSNMLAVADAVNRMYPGAAEVMTDGRTVKVAVPADLPESQHVAYLNSFLTQEIESDNAPRVIVNERTGVIVIGGDVRLRPGAIAHGAIVVTVAETPQVSQPNPLSGGTTETAPRTDISITEEAGALTAIPEAVTLQEVVDVLNVLGASPRDLISILAAMSDGGLLVADIKRL
ncbi:MAG: flagellar basal body P-ring protein FlgI [Planctomycetes bacterium]|nr:flagellar basal body P-ring protein FlgI [Planctomycetota bacterium]